MMISDNNLPTDASVLVMLDADCAQPCYTFGGRNEYSEKLSVDGLRNAFRWIAQQVPFSRDVRFLVGVVEPLSLIIAETICDIGHKLVLPLITLEKQNALRIPFSEHQVVVAESLKCLKAKRLSIAGRPLILHLTKEEISDLAAVLLECQDDLGGVTIRLREIHMLCDSDIIEYGQQLGAIADASLAKSLSAMPVAFRIHNLRHRSRSDVTDQCPAGRSIITIGPDQRLYPCPSFYNTNNELDIGNVRGGDDYKLTVLNHVHSTACCCAHPCLANDTYQAAKLAEAERSVVKDQMWRVATSPYLFDCLRMRLAQNAADRSRQEGEEKLRTSHQEIDVTFDEFAQAHCDIHRAAESSNFDVKFLNSLLEKWGDIEGQPASARRNVFRRRVRETLDVVSRIHSSAAESVERQPFTFIDTAARNMHSKHRREWRLGDGDLQAIAALYQQELGWAFLFNATIEDVRMGFDCTNEIAVIRANLVRARDNVHRWFQVTAKRERWESDDEGRWEVDFDKGVVYLSLPGLLKKGSLCSSCSTCVGTVGGLDMEVIRRLFEERSMIADIVRPRIRDIVTNEEQDDNLNELITGLGAASERIRNWFLSMAEIYHWQTPPDDHWQYRLDMAESKVFLDVRESGCGCSEPSDTVDEVAY